MGVTKSMYSDSYKARCWYLAIIQLIHPDILLHERVGEALTILDEIYDEMLAKCTKIAGKID